MRLRASCVGMDAREALARPGAITVLAAFEHGAYLETAAGSLVYLGPESLGAGPRGLNCAIGSRAWPAAALSRGARGTIDGATLRIGALGVDWRAATTWWPPALPDVDWQARLPAGLDAIARLAAEDRPAHGLAPLLATTPTPGESALLDTARPLLEAMGAWVAGEADSAAPAAGLIGLGPGLTPSGDDALAAALVALHAIGARSQAAALARVVAANTARTGPISRAHLASASRGAGTAALHDLLAAIAHGVDGEVHTAARALARTGHSSGWDALTGLAYVGAACLRR